MSYSEEFSFIIYICELVLLTHEHVCSILLTRTTKTIIHIGDSIKSKTRYLIQSIPFHPFESRSLKRSTDMHNRPQNQCLCPSPRSQSRFTPAPIISSINPCIHTHPPSFTPHYLPNSRLGIITGPYFVGTL